MTLILLLWLLVAQPSRLIVGSDATYRSQPGDTLFTVARRQGLGLEHLAWANRRPVDLKPLPARDYVLPLRRILPKPVADGLVLNLPERAIYHFRGGEFQGFYPVAIGMPGWNTPVGQFHIATRTTDPTWFPPAWAGVAGPVGPGPDNPLGDRWMGLSLGGYGIHATNRPDSIGGAVSHGCIRMYPEMARQLYAQVSLGCPVRIEYEPVKAGWDGQAFEGLLCVFPDVYGRCDLKAEARRALADVGLLPWVDEPWLGRLLAHPSGRAEWVAGEQLRWKETSFPAARRQGRLYCTTELLEALSLQWEEDGERIRVFDDASELWLTPVPLGGRAMLPLAQTLQHFGLSYQVKQGRLELIP